MATNLLSLMGVGTAVASGGGSFTPLSLPGLVAWYDATTGVTSSGGNVSQWNDQSGNGYNLTRLTGSPTLNATSFNGHPGITTTAGFDSLNTASTVALNSTSMSVFVLFISQTGGDTNGRIFSFFGNGHANDYDNTSSFELQQTGGATQQVSGLSNLTTLGNGGAAFNYAFTTAQSVGLIFNGTNVAAYVSFVAQGTASAFTATLGGATAGGVALGQYGIGNSGNRATAQGVYAEIVVTSNAISGANQTNLKNYWNTKWGAF